MPVADVIPIKPDIDPREYLHITLENGMRIALISDPYAESAAGCVSVAAGSYDDPPDLPGLAHFCEHMLFFGSERFPGEHAFKAFVDSTGGNSNAYTAEDHTSYQFQVAAPAFLPAIDRFGAFFTAPLFPEDGTAREVKAIQSEFEMYIQDDTWRALHLLKHFADKAHPLHRFTVGSIETLKVPEGATPMHERVRAWWGEHYHAQAMTAAFCGPVPLGAMKAAVVAAFGSLPRGTRAPLREGLLRLLGGRDPMAELRLRGRVRDGLMDGVSAFATVEGLTSPLETPVTAAADGPGACGGGGAGCGGGLLSPFSDASAVGGVGEVSPFSPMESGADPLHPHAPRLWCEYLPVADEPSASIYWPIPTELMAKVSHSGVPYVLGHLIGHEGDGSILDALKRRDLANGLCAGESTAGLFNVTVELTRKGQKQVADVVAIVFAYIADLFATVGLPDPADKRVEKAYGADLVAPTVERNSVWYERLRAQWNELQSLNEIAFRYEEPSPPIQQTTTIAATMLHLEDPERCIRGVSLPEMDEEQLRLYLLHLRPCNAFVMIANPVPVDACEHHDQQQQRQLLAMRAALTDSTSVGTHTTATTLAVLNANAQGDIANQLDTPRASSDSIADNDDDAAESTAAFSPGVWDDRWQRERWVSVRFREASEAPTAVGGVRVWDARGRISGRKAPLPLPEGFDVRDLSLPLPNPFVPSAKCFEVQAAADEPEVMEAWQPPRQIADGVWLSATGRAFQAPLGIVRVALLSPQYPSGTAPAVALALFTDCIKDSLNRVLYAASLTKLEVSVSSSARAVVVEVSGFSSAIGPLLAVLINAVLRRPLSRQRAAVIVDAAQRKCCTAALAASDVDVGLSSSFEGEQQKGSPQASLEALVEQADYPADVFTRVYQAIARRLKNTLLQQPFAYVMSDMLPQALQTLHTDSEGQYRALAASVCTMEQMMSYVDCWRSSVVSQVLLVGAWTPDAAHEIIKVAAPRTSSKPLRHLLNRAVLPPRGVSQASRALADKDNVNHCVAHAMYVGGRSLQIANLRWLVSHALQGAFFAALRTQEQTGYVNQVIGMTLGHMNVIVMVVQSSVVPPMELAARYQAFLDGPGLALFENMPDEVLCQLIGGLIGQLREQPLKNADLMQVQWPQIAEFRYTFDVLPRQIELVQRITRDDLVRFYKRYMVSNAEERRVLRLIAVPAGTPLPPVPPGVHDANDLTEWQAMQPLLPAWEPL